MKAFLILTPIIFVVIGLVEQTNRAPQPAGYASSTKQKVQPKRRQINGEASAELLPFLASLRWGGEAQARGDYNEAERQYRKVVDIVPNAPVGYRYLARLYDKQGREREAYAAWGRALAQYEPYASSMRDDPGPLVHFGDLAARYGTPGESAEAYALAIAAGDRDDVWEPRPAPRDGSYLALKAAAHAAAAAENIWGGEGHAAALRELDVALAADPSLWTAHYYRACVYSRHRRTEEAVREAALAERLAPPKGRRQVRWMRAGRGLPDPSGRLLSIPPAPKSGSWTAPPDLPDAEAASSER